MSQAHVHELIGVGVGVFNLSLAALLEDNGFRDALFFDAQPKVGWHGGMLLDSSELQVHYLKDLVTPVDPTSRFTFLNYLKERGLLYQFINRKSSSISRNQFQYYFRWVADQLPTLRFDSRVQSVTFDGDVFTVTVDGQEYFSRHIAVATGIAPLVPAFAQEHLGDKVFHVRDYLHRRDALDGRRIAIIGGGQSGAEVVMDVMENVHHDSLHWLGRRMAFSQLEDNCFVNELYVPSFTQVFRDYPAERKREFVERMAMSSDGINQGLLDRIYRLAFERRFFSPGSRAYQFMTGQEMTGLDATEDGLRISMRSWVDGAAWQLDADAVVLATGFRPSGSTVLRGVLGDAADTLCVGQNFEVRWEHEANHHIFLQNGSRMCIGLADPNLSIAAWRAAMIANRILGGEPYTMTPDTPMIDHRPMERMA